MQSKNYPCLNEYLELFYKKNIKIVRKELLDKISCLGLAFWYMDDGSRHHNGKGCNIHTNGFSLEENKIIKDWLLKKWQIEAQIKEHREPKRYPGKVWYFLYFNGENAFRLFNIIHKHIHPSMRYKLRGFKLENN